MLADVIVHQGGRRPAVVLPERFQAGFPCHGTRFFRKPVEQKSLDMILVNLLDERKRRIGGNQLRKIPGVRGGTWSMQLDGIKRPALRQQLIGLPQLPEKLQRPGMHEGGQWFAVRPRLGIDDGWLQAVA